MKMITVQLLRAARDWTTKTTDRVTLWTNGFV